MLNCVQVTRLYSEAQERALSVSERMSLRVHVMMCSGCRNFGQQMSVLRNAARTYAKGATPLDDDRTE